MKLPTTIAMSQQVQSSALIIIVTYGRTQPLAEGFIVSQASGKMLFLVWGCGHTPKQEKASDLQH